MIITPSALTVLMIGFRREFQQALADTPADWDKAATLVPSSAKSNTYGWLGQFPQFREWIGDRVVKDMAAQSYAITNKDYESTVGVKRTDIEDDNIGVYAPLFSEMGRAAASHPDELVFSLLAAGFTTNCYDGQFFFDTDHPVYPNVDGTGTATTVSNFGGGTGTPWYLLDVSRALKPLIFQQRKAPVFTAMTKVDDEQVFTANEYRYGIDSRCNVGFGFWQQAYASKQTLDVTGYAAARAAMMSVKADGGRPLGIRPTLLVVPPSLESAALEVLKAERDANGKTNVYQNTAELVVSPWLS